MSGRVCFLGRSDRGDRLASVRLASRQGGESWDPPEAAGDAIAVVDQARSAADWLAQRVGGEGLSALCLDLQAARCEWLTAPSGEEPVVLAALNQSESRAARAGGFWATPGPQEAAVQALTIPAQQPAGAKLAVLIQPDVTARLFIDELDAKGVEVRAALSLWHALALAWDPSSPSRATPADGPTSAPLTAVVVVDPAGRLVWSWSDAGTLLAGGTIALAHDARQVPQVVTADVARIVNDWLGWAAQLGRAPARIIAVVPEIADSDAGLSPAEFGSALGRAWRGAPVDLAIHDDPIGATMARLQDAPQAVLERAAADARQSLTRLSHRPGRAHRSMFYWASGALACAALALAAVGVKAWAASASAKSARAQALAAIREAVRPVAQSVAPNDGVQLALAEANPRSFLEEQLLRKRAAANPTAALDVAKPILAELDTLSYIIGTKEVEIDEISILPTHAYIDLSIPDTPTGEAIKNAIESIEGSACRWEVEFAASGRRANKQALTLKGTWKKPAGGTGGAS
ncbi:MAG: hypothetical protein JNM80_12350 [Phycisphaerae bacterium]|nr:hypothetical protein [Phycisphaerae bacterium]